MKKIIAIIILFLSSCTIVPLDAKNNERFNETLGQKQNYREIPQPQTIPVHVDKGKKVKEVIIRYIFEE